MIEQHGDQGVRVLTLAQPQRGNALSEALVEALIAAVETSCADPTLHTLVIDAQGRHFCTGFDLGDAPQASAEPQPDNAADRDGPLLWRFARIEQLLALLWHAPLRTVAIAQGRAWGAGADLFAACDLRCATPETQWRFPGAGFGIVLGTRRLAALVQEPQAMAWVTQGQTIDGAQALASGLATALLPDASDWRQHLPPLAVDRATYAQLKAATRPDHRDADLAALVRSAAAPGLRQRMAAYRERSRRPPP
ncbi:enoyl-CoA hydratase/isomerase family protein [Hydrogenophaga sp. OTU3427]|uniref:enoyl-CoA hydratase/isomerase family protein n=1 Tax=Hydrogenophaga sp. OTU3427 TaxID=3043856 RepID=UPI00313C5ACD